MYKTKSKKGITLVALVITIIVLMILAGVAISLATGQNSIFSKANNAATKWNTAVGKESNTIKNILAIADQVTGGGDDDDEVNPPTPAGYEVSEISSEDSVSEGLVIYEIPEGATVNWKEDEADGTNESTITKGGNTTNLQETVNQYVWIPVEEINDMVMCESNNKLPEGEGNKICNIKLVKEEGSEEEILKCTNPDHSTTATNLVGRLYTSTRTSTTDGDNTIYSYTIDFKKRDQTYDESGYHEPNTVSSDSSNKITIDQLKSDFTAMATSVERYGGFYISRYEIGAEGSSKKGQPVLTAATTGGGSGATEYLGANKWYGLYNTIKNSGANKQMIWGCQYDQVIKFLKENEQYPEIGHTYIAISRTLSGKNEQDCMNNIYDLEGNHNEWTAEAYSTVGRAARGSYYSYANSGGFYPASYRNISSPTGSLPNYSSRTTLYL